jgi:hypothetical protein
LKIPLPWLAVEDLKIRSEQDRHNRVGRIGQAEMDQQNRTGRTSQAEQER